MSSRTPSFLRLDIDPLYMMYYCMLLMLGVAIVGVFIHGAGTLHDADMAFNMCTLELMTDTEFYETSYNAPPISKEDLWRRTLFHLRIADGFAILFLVALMIMIHLSYCYIVQNMRRKQKTP